eukprot:SAG22_NODE_437_length_10501_cov_3.019804_9_plen_262_part_00
MPAPSASFLIRAASVAAAASVAVFALSPPPSKIKAEMSLTFSGLRAQNAAVRIAKGEAVVTGGTAGLGAAVALRLAEAGCSVTIVGRDATRGAANVERLAAASTAAGVEGGAHKFCRCDAFSLANVISCAEEIRSSSATGKLDFLVLSQGMATTQGFTPTPDGLDQKLTLHYFSRVQLLTALLPMLEAAPSGARVLSVLSGGVHAAPATFRDDPELKQNYGLKAAADTAGFYNDIALDTLAREHPTVGFVHAAPGFVSTSW